jgi:hypothetical protein
MWRGNAEVKRVQHGRPQKLKSKCIEKKIKGTMEFISKDNSTFEKYLQIKPSAGKKSCCESLVN